jgi:hypothetical protein
MTEMKLASTIDGDRWPVRWANGTITASALTSCWLSVVHCTHGDPGAGKSMEQADIGIAAAVSNPRAMALPGQPSADDPNSSRRLMSAPAPVIVSRE